MTVVTTRPNATVSGTGFTASAGTRHACTSDDSDTTYLTAVISESMYLGFVEPTIPAGGLVKTVTLRHRGKKGGTGAGTPPVITFYVFPDNAAATVLSSTISWTTITTVTAGSFAWSTTPGNLVVAAVHAGGATALLHELYVDTTYVAKPVTAPSAPTGTLTTTNKPTIEWANTLDSDGGDQTHFQVRVFSSAQYGAGGFNPATSTATDDSGITQLPGVTSWSGIDPLPDGTYRAYVRVAQTVNGVQHWSDYAYTGFVVDVDLPAVPDTPTLTVQTGRIKVHVEGNTGTATTTDLEVQRSEDGGTTWEPLRLTTDTDGVITGTSADVYDYEAPNGTLMSYRVRALHNYSGLYVASDWTATATATWTDTAWWLKCPEHPSLNMVVAPDSIPSYQRPVRQGVFQALGSAETVIVADERGAPRGTMRLQIDTAQERENLDALLDANATLLLQGPPAHHWPDRYIRIGDQDRARWIDKAWVEPVVDTLPWWEVARPDGVVVAWPA